MSQTKFVVTVTKPAPRSQSRRAFAKPPGEEHEPADGLAVVAVALVIFPDFSDFVRMDERGGVVAGEGAGIFFRNVEGFGDATEDHVKGLPLKAAHPRRARLVEAASGTVKVVEEEPSLVKAIARHLQGHVGLHRRAFSGFVGGKGGSERAGRGEVAEGFDHAHGLGIDGLRVEGDVARDAADGIVRSRDAGVEGADVGPERVFPDDGLDVVGSGPGGERSHDREFVREGGEPGKGRAEGDAGQRGSHLAGGGSYPGGLVHLRIKGLRLRGAAVHEEEHDRAVFDEAGVKRLRGEELRQRERGSAHPECPHPQK